MSRPAPDLERAADFVWRNARLVDRLRLGHFLGEQRAGAGQAGDADAVVAAVRAYQNPDGGFGHALEPDLRAPGSQPAAVHRALDTLGQVDRLGDPMVVRACDYLASIANPDGGVPFALPAAGYPRAPWWEAAIDNTSGIAFTAGIAAVLHRHRVQHPWLTAATAWCWRALDAFAPADFRGDAWTLPRVGAGYEARALFAFLDAVSDPRRDDAVARLGRTVVDRGLVDLTPGATHEGHVPLDYAPTPDAAARRFFDDAVIEAHVDARVRAQQDDGGWTFHWPAWNPATTLDWRGAITVDTLRLLRAYGRISTAT